MPRWASRRPRRKRTRTPRCAQAKQAFEADPSLAPAAVAYAKRLREGGRERSAQDVLRRAWSMQPQPDVADTFLAPFSDAPSRYKAASGLASANPGHPDSALLLARTALDAGLVADARRHAETARKAGLNDRRLWLLMADLAEHDGGGEASQEALRHIPTASPGPSWRCLQCGTLHGDWHPVCDACKTPRQDPVAGGRSGNSTGAQAHGHAGDRRPRLRRGPGPSRSGKTGARWAAPPRAQNPNATRLMLPR